MTFNQALTLAGLVGTFVGIFVGYCLYCRRRGDDWRILE